MKVSRKELSRYIDLTGLSDHEISKRLTFAGIEVEDYYSLASGTNLVIGEVKKAEKVKDSGHLTLCEVFLGKEKGMKQIICGAPNVRAGLKVIVAEVGAVLPEVTIKAATIKGYQSEGMICSLKELGVPTELISVEDETGIHELDKEAIVGNTNVFAYLDLDDTIFDLKPLANRSDMLAIYNIVRELGALFARPYTLPSYDVKPSFTSNLQLEVKTPLVSVFSLSEVRGITVKESPLWLKKMLLKHGHRPINNIVDIGNYVMLLTGRPLHMYDLDEVGDETFIISDDKTMSFVALDEKKYDLLPGDQIIHDQREVLCLGGVMGALNSSVKEKTKRIAIEVAVFDTSQIRSTVTRLNLPSEASSRFSKGVNPNNTMEAMALALYLVKELNKDATFSNAVTVTNEKEAQETIIFDEKRINALLGTSFTRKEMVDVLARLNIIVNNDNKVTLPSYRQDIYSLADLAEEVIRVLGFSHVKSELPALMTAIGEYDEVQKARYDIRKLLRSIGLYETLNYALTSKEKLAEFKFLNKDEALALEHPMTPLRAYLRLNLLPSLVETLSYNVSRQMTNVALFEVSNITSKNYKGEHLAFLFSGVEEINEKLVTRPYDFYDAKGLVLTLLNYLGLNESRYEIIKNELFTSDLHPAQSAILRVQGKVVGVFGKMHPTIQKAYGINNDTIVGEINLKALLDLKTGGKKVSIPPRFPYVSRDLSLVVNKEISVQELIKVVKQAGGKLVVEVSVFDVYTKLINTPNKKSVALTIRLQDAEKTLVESEIKEVLTKVIDALNTKLQAEVRS